MIFSNRELAIGLWLILFLIAILSYSKTRKMVPHLLNTIFSRKILILKIFMIAYFVFMIMVLAKIGYWENYLLKDSLIWFISVGITSVYNIINFDEDVKFFKKYTKDNITIFLVITFVLNFYSYSLWLEFIQVLVILILSIAVTEGVRLHPIERINVSIKNKLSIFLAVIGFTALFYSIRMFIISYDSIVISKLVKAFFLPCILSIIFALFVYIVLLYASYEKLFVRLRFKKTIDDRYRKYLMFRIILFCNISVNRVNRFMKFSGVDSGFIKSKSDIDDLIKNHINERLS